MLLEISPEAAGGLKCPHSGCIYRTALARRDRRVSPHTMRASRSSLTCATAVSAVSVLTSGNEKHGRDGRGTRAPDTSLVAHQQVDYLSFPITASVNSFVPAVPPR